MTDAILVLNAGSSSIKFSVFEACDGELAASVRGQAEELYSSRPRFVARDAAGRVLVEKAWNAGNAPGHAGGVAHIDEFVHRWLATSRLLGVGHRVVHGGLDYTRPVRLDATSVASLEAYIPLAPLHQPHNLTPIKLLLASQPELPQIACFDTSFHRSNADLAQRFALPQELHDAGVRRYGFHGLSYEYIASVLPIVDARAASGRTVVLHLGNGASMCALAGGSSVASSMGFTAVDGLMMGTRCGAIDPGVILYLMDQRGMDARAIERLIYHQSGLLGVSGISSDMRVLLDHPDPRAALAIDLFLYRVRRELGSLAAALGGIDALVFTAGIGENSATIRERVLADAAWLGVEIDVQANARGGPCISAAGSRVAAYAIATNEELMIARHTLRLLQAGR